MYSENVVKCMAGQDGKCSTHKKSIGTIKNSCQIFTSTRLDIREIWFHYGGLLNDFVK